MKKAVLLGVLAMSLTSLPALAQKSKVTSAWMYLKHDELDKAKDAINEASDNAETKDDPKTWTYRGNIYSAIAQSADPKMRALDNNAVGVAIQSYSKAISLDPKGKYAEVFDSLNAIAQRSYNAGVNAYNQKNYDEALKKFTNFFDSYYALGNNNKGVQLMLAQVQLKPEDVKLFMAGAAQGANKPEIAQKVYQELVDANYEEPTIYTGLADMYRKQGDTMKAIAVLDKGLGHLQDKKALLIDKLNTYIQMGKSKEAIDLGKSAIEADPKNASIYIAVGNIYDYKLNMPQEAQDMYNKAIALNPEDFNVNYSLGASFFNQGAAVYNQSLNEKDYTKAGKLEDQAKDIWKKAIPYMEKAHQLKPDDNDVLSTLAEMYAKIGDFDKSKKYRDMIKKK